MKNVIRQILRDNMHDEFNVTVITGSHLLVLMIIFCLVLSQLDLQARPSYV